MLFNRLKLARKEYSNINADSSLEANFNCTHFICGRKLLMAKHGLIFKAKKGGLDRNLHLQVCFFFNAVLSSHTVAHTPNCMALSASVSDRRIKLVIRNHSGA